MIRTHESEFGTDVASFLLRLSGKSELPTKTASTYIPVEVNHSRWIVNCIFCNSAQMASENDPRFWCVHCHNEGVGGAWLPVAWPKERAQIEAVLLERPEHSTRNWKVTETVKDLKRENIQRGL